MANKKVKTGSAVTNAEAEDDDVYCILGNNTRVYENIFTVGACLSYCNGSPLASSILSDLFFLLFKQYTCAYKQNINNKIIRQFAIIDHQNLKMIHHLPNLSLLPQNHKRLKI